MIGISIEGHFILAVYIRKAVPRIGCHRDAGRLGGIQIEYLAQIPVQRLASDFPDEIPIGQPQQSADCRIKRVFAHDLLFKFVATHAFGNTDDPLVRLERRKREPFRRPVPPFRSAPWHQYPVGSYIDNFEISCVIGGIDIPLVFFDICDHLLVVGCDGIDVIHGNSPDLVIWCLSDLWRQVFFWQASILQPAQHILRFIMVRIHI